ncbi:MAG: hypothetical protein M9894_38535 [Planctomycetes bacterium]|nr:hypothetical protein [Planctomycetota bacterium]
MTSHLRHGLIALAVLAGCGDASRRSASPAVGTAVAPVSSATIGPPGSLSPAFRAEVARAFAPELRFNAYHDDGNRSPQNRHEDFFPMGVASFLAELEAGAARVLVQPSRGPAPGVSQVRPFSSRPVLRGAQLEGYPRYMVGDEPGTAPVYVHVYEDPAGRALAPDGSGELVVFAEYWFFYAHDRSEARLLGAIGTSGAADVTGHRADWEHISLRLRVRTAAGGVFAGGELDHGSFYGHGGAVVAGPGELERVDDAGADDPAGRHPVVYVAQGKHASYPEAGEWRGHAVPTWLADHTDFFRGNGVRIACWQVPLPDLEDPDALPQEFAPQAFRTLQAASPHTVAHLRDWTEYRGRWGPDLALFGTTVLGLSPTGPKAKTKYGDQGGLTTFPRWADLKRRSPGLKVYRDLGIVIPRVLPPPAPSRS